MKLLFLLTLLFSCLEVQAGPIDPIYHQMTGTYMSPGSKNTGTKLSLNGDQFEYEFYTDVHANTEIRETKKLGQHLILNNIVYVPFVNLYRHKQGGKIKFVTSSSINLWHIDDINNTTVLISDDQYGAWKTQHKMPSSSGILIRVSAKPYKFDIEQPSLKALEKPDTNEPEKAAIKEPTKSGTDKKESAKPDIKAAAKPGAKQPEKADIKESAKPTGKKEAAKNTIKEPAKPSTKETAKAGIKAPAKPDIKAQAKPGKKAPAKPDTKEPAKPVK